MIKTLEIILLNVLLSSISFCQDTIQLSNPPNGWFWIDQYNSNNNTWLRKDFFDSILFSIEELDSSKFYPTGKFTGFYENGSIAFKREYIFDGEYSEIHGKKIINYPNGNLKEEGQYLHNIKIGIWIYYSKDGDTIRKTEYNIPHSDTITNSKFQIAPPISRDTIDIKERRFTDEFSIVDFGKNGFELIYENNIPVKLVLYENGKAILTETKYKKIKKLLTANKRH